MSGYATITVNASSWARVTRERDEARDDCERLNRLLRHETALGQGEVDHWAALERERDEAREQNEEQARLLAMSADREEKLRTELQQARDCFSAAMELAERYKAERDAMP